MATTASEPLLLTVTWALSFEYCVWKPSIIELYTQWFSTPSGHSVQREQSGAAYVGGYVSLTRPVSVGYFCAFWSEVSSSFIPHLESAKNQNLNPDVMRATRHRPWPARAETLSATLVKPSELTRGAQEAQGGERQAERHGDETAQSRGHRAGRRPGFSELAPQSHGGTWAALDRAEAARGRCQKLLGKF